MEAAGAVFLPAAGAREHTLVYHDNLAGFYWSSTHYDNPDPEEYDDYEALLLHFIPESVEATTHIRRDNGLSVRLVQDR